MTFFIEILLGGVLSGLMYSLVALGFVLIYKASGVFNFAQGAMVLLAGLALVRSLDWLVAKGFPAWSAIVVGLLFAAAVMAITAWLVERFVLGPLVNQDGLILFMSTIGVTFILEGASQMIFGSDVYPLRLFPDDAWFVMDKTFEGGFDNIKNNTLFKSDNASVTTQHGTTGSGSVAINGEGIQAEGKVGAEASITANAHGEVEGRYGKANYTATATAEAHATAEGTATIDANGLNATARVGVGASVSVEAEPSTGSTTNPLRSAR